MPQLVKGGKWVFGWVLVGPQGAVTIPPGAWDEYAFQTEDEVIFLPGSRRSGGFGLSTPRLLEQMGRPLQVRVLARGQIAENRQVIIPPTIGIRPGDRLLAVRGSGKALGFVATGPIYEEALRHPSLEVFGEEK
jgi:hypothetical protein